MTPQVVSSSVVRPLLVHHSTIQSPAADGESREHHTTRQAGGGVYTARRERLWKTTHTDRDSGTLHRQNEIPENYRETDRDSGRLHKQKEIPVNYSEGIYRVGRETDYG